MSKLNYEDFVKKALNEQDYSKRQLKIAFTALSRMDNESRKWFIKFIFTGSYPTAVVEDVTVEKLVNDLKYTSIQAFLVFDWLKHEPDKAKYYIVKPSAKIETVSEETANKMREYLKQQGIKINDSADASPQYIDDNE